MHFPSFMQSESELYYPHGPLTIFFFIISNNSGSSFWSGSLALIISSILVGTIFLTNQIKI